MKKSKIRESARGEDCQVRLIGICNFDPSTVIFAHLGGGGMAEKVPDLFGAYCCSKCHDVVDNRVSTDLSRAAVALDFFDGMVRTQEILLKNGLISIK